MTIYGKIDCYLPLRTATGNCGKQLFTAIYKALLYFESQSICEQIARFNGTGTTAGDPTWPDEAKPFGTNAWYVFRFPPSVNRTWSFYVHFHWSTWGVAYGLVNHPARYLGADGNMYEQCGIQAARGIGSINSIWNGTTLKDGTDIKGTAPYWIVPSGGSRVAVFPRSNGVGGNYVSDKRNFISLLNQDADGIQRAHIVTDGDALVIMNSIGSNAYGLTYVGMLDVDPIATEGVMGFLRIGIPWSANQVYGNKTNSVDPEIAVDYNQERLCVSDRGIVLNNSAGTYYPNRLLTPNRYTTNGIPIWVGESGAYGYAGKLRSNLIIETYGLPSHTVNGDLTWAFFNNNTSNTFSLGLAWDGVSTPGFSTSNEGVEFAR